LCPSTCRRHCGSGFATENRSFFAVEGRPCYGERGSEIDILQLIERLEGLVERGQCLPLTGKVIIDESAFLNIIDQMWITVPEEVKRCREMEQERDKYIARAREEAQQILAQAREDVAKRLDEHVIRHQAEAQAEEILAQAKERAAQVRQGADDYARGTLKDLQERLGRLQAVVENGLNRLNERQRGQSLPKEEESFPEEEEEPSPSVQEVEAPQEEG